MKQLLKDEFGLYDEGVNKKTGETFRVYISTADINRKQFAEFTEKIVMFANSTLQLNILTPEEFFEN